MLLVVVSGCLLLMCNSLCVFLMILTNYFDLFRQNLIILCKLSVFITRVNIICSYLISLKKFLVLEFFLKNKSFNAVYFHMRILTCFKMFIYVQKLHLSYTMECNYHHIFGFIFHSQQTRCNFMLNWRVFKLRFVGELYCLIVDFAIVASFLFSCIF